MLVFLNILFSRSLNGILFCPFNLISIKNTTIVEGVSSRKWCKILIYSIVIYNIFYFIGFVIFSLIVVSGN